jgi:hypothetical protein
LDFLASVTLDSAVLLRGGIQISVQSLASKIIMMDIEADDTIDNVLLLHGAVQVLVY